MNEKMQAVELDRESTIESVSNDLLRDFYQSFRLSQGNMDIQNRLTDLLAIKYGQTVNPSDLVAALENAKAMVERLSVPRQHVAQDRLGKVIADSAGVEFKRAFQYWESKFEEIEYLIERHADNCERDFWIGRLLSKIAEIDQRYQAQERPNRHGDSDVHMSILREYIIRDALKGSAYLIELRNELRDGLFNLAASDKKGDRYRENVLTLAAAWQDNHADESFWPVSE